MNFVKLFFSFSGRIGRSVYFGGLVANIFAVLTFAIIVETIILAAGLREAAIAFRFVSFPIILLASLASLAALHVKRLHDLARGPLLVPATFILLGLCGWWIAWSLKGISGDNLFPLLLASPGIATFVFIIALYTYPRGQHGPNRYGPDPRDEEKGTEHLVDLNGGSHGQARNI